jgi:hypothetical protein
MSVGAYGYLGMFEDCTSLEKAPELPAKSLTNQVYATMFSGCTSLTKVPELPATSLYQGCYYNMFKNCTSLKSAPKLPVKTLSQECYSGMFSGCTSLTDAPELPATSVASGCYQSMFSGCTSLTKAPELFVIPQLYMCYSQMFKGCIKLSYLHVSFTSWGNGTAQWLIDASSNGVFDCPSTLDTTTRDVSHVPSGWIVTHGANEPEDGTTSVVEATTTDVYTVCPSEKETGVLTVSSALTLNAYPATSTDIAYAEVVLDIDANAIVTAGTNLTLVDTPTAGKRNVCVVRWSGGVAKLYVTIVEDLPQA